MEKAKINGFPMDSTKETPCDLSLSQDGKGFYICMVGMCRAYGTSGYNAEYFCSGCKYLHYELYSE